ncbi:hypothetical protein AWC25_23190 [Mycobacterium sherrisii]|nr:hypothetical protein AWC25_23190 [Mycobacterium sherrisii]
MDHRIQLKVSIQVIGKGFHLVTFGHRPIGIHTRRRVGIGDSLPCFIELRHFFPLVFLFAG